VRLADRVIIVTGAAGGLGLACARRLLADGADVMLVDCQEPSPDVESLVATSPKARFFRADVASESDTMQMVEQTLSAFGRVDVLINNAAVFTSLSRRFFDALTVEEWEKILRVNVIGVFLCTKAVVPAMKSRKRGKIINVSSNVVHKGLPYLLHYVASKGAVTAMTRSLARELGEHGITVNGVAPGYMLHERTAQTDQGRNEQVVRLRALGKTQTPEDVVGTIAFLASADSDFLTGQTLIVDGGEVFA
jgi:NAD(P)-dependent dehydrogenase (short-subunit alcohol dehydrogenase family)